ncbi:helix-turn-helix domain-containing protein [Microseira wollei]|uniref:helix-turn-helix domain-containing protein n=1 Tax=Microseira wollei TaxID=467598 RepID=UPI0035A237A6
MENIEKSNVKLDEWIKTNPDPRELKKALAVKLSLQGWAYRAIASLLGVASSSISDWKKRYMQAGVLRSKPGILSLFYSF